MPVQALLSGFSPSLTLKLAGFVGGALVVIAVFAFTQQNIRSLSHEVSTTSRVLARFLAQASFPATNDPELQTMVSDVMATIDFPIIVTDGAGWPRAWRHIEVDPALVPSESIDSLFRGIPIAPEIRERYARVQSAVAGLDRKNPPVPMRMPGVEQSVGAVHYGDPPVLERLRWMPFLSLAAALSLLAIGFWGLAILRQAEKRTIWIGMAKETAHQLGTPLSSLMGWIEMLKAHGETGRAGDDVRVPAAELEETVTEMERDVERLNKVAHRFSRIGSEPKLECLDATPFVADVVAYMRRRMPQAPGDVEIRERFTSAPPVWLNPELLQWALENLITNALNALDKRPGLIEVSVGPLKDGRGVEVVVSDNGRGMSPAERRRAFEPGFTTRRRGWGLGLALARRVIEEYHRGRIFIGQTSPGRGTSMVVHLPG